MCFKCKCQKTYEFDTDSFYLERIQETFGDVNSIILRVKVDKETDERGFLNLLSLKKDGGVILANFTEEQRVYLEENYGFKFNPLNDKLAVKN